MHFNVSMNGALHGGHYTIEIRCRFLGKWMLQVSKSKREQEHQLALAREHYKAPLKKVQKGARPFVTQPCTSLREFQLVDF